MIQFVAVLYCATDESNRQTLSPYPAMQFLLHDDYVIHAIQKEDTRILELCSKKIIDAWVAASSIPNILNALSEKDNKDAAQEKLYRFLSAVAVLPVGGAEIKDSLKPSLGAPTESIALRLWETCSLDGIVTLNADAFPESDAVILSPDQAAEKVASHDSDTGRVPLLNIPATYPQSLEEIEQEILEVIRSGYFILGPKVEALEKEMARYCGAPFAVGVSSGTDALLISLMAAGVEAGDEVITTPFTFFATAGSIARLGAKPVFVDIEDDSFNIDPKKIEAVITPKSRAVIPVHLYGQSADMDPINEVAQKNNLIVIEDAAQSTGAEYKGKKVGSLGDFGCLSFFPTKNLGGFGDGGMVTANSPRLNEKLKILRMHGSAPKYYHKEIGGNFRLDAIQAAILLAKLPYLDHALRCRKENAKRYDSLFADKGLTEQVRLPKEVVEGHTYNQYCIRVDGSKRDALREFLGKQDVMTEIYYPLSLHQQECFADLGYKNGDFPVSERAAEEVLALPISNEVTAAQQVRVVEAISRFFS